MTLKVICDLYYLDLYKNCICEQNKCFIWMGIIVKRSKIIYTVYLSLYLSYKNKHIYLTHLCRGLFFMENRSAVLYKLFDVMVRSYLNKIQIHKCAISKIYK